MTKRVPRSREGAPTRSKTDTGKLKLLLVGLFFAAVWLTLWGRAAYVQLHLGPELKKQFGGFYVANEAHTRDTAEQLLQAGEADAVAFGKLFIANPDLPRRFARNAPLNAPVPETFYASGPGGYTDYPALPD